MSFSHTLKTSRGGIKVFEKGTLTIAFGADRYLNMAETLALSLKRFSPNIPRALVTDMPDSSVCRHFNHVIPLDHRAPRDLRQKLYIDLYTPFRRTLFIDSDCITFEDLDYILFLMSSGVEGQLYRMERS
jgi:hypothetical protein